MTYDLSFKNTWKSDLISGFLVFLVALPLCLGIAKASGFPPISGILTAIIGGLLVSFFVGSEMTIKGPAAGLIVIALGAVTDLGQGDPFLGYKLTLAVIVVAGVVQIIFGLLKTGVLGDFFPTSAVHGMLAAIGIIIISKQAHFLMGVTPTGGEPLELLKEIPKSFSMMNPDIAIIGVISLIILFGLPMIKNKYVRMVPAPMVVLLIAIPLGAYFDLSHEHTYLFNHTQFTLSPKFLVTLPAQITDAIQMPNWSQITSMTSIKYVIMFALVGSIESLLSGKAIDGLDPYKRKSDLNKDLLAVGIGNTVSGLLGGLPMISEIARSSANVNNGGKTRWSNFFHGGFLLIFVVFLPMVIQRIPIAALAAMLISVGWKLASPKEFIKTYKVGAEQLIIFVMTVVATLATDLLIGIGMGILTKFALHIIDGVPFASLFRPILTIDQSDPKVYVVDVQHSAIFSNYIGLKKRLEKLDPDRDVIIDFTNSHLVDHSVMEKMHEMEREFATRGVGFHIRGLESHLPKSDHPAASRKKPSHTMHH